MEDAFLRKLAAQPADDTTRLIYADWLEEQGTDEADRKAEFLRAQCLPLVSEAEGVEERLQQLAASLSVNWLAVVSKLKVESCNGPDPGGQRPSLRFNFVCEMRWEDMTPTAASGTRHCSSCRTQVHYCDTITEARHHAWQGQCVAVDIGIIRRDRDLDRPMRLIGKPSLESLQQRREAQRPDPVSAERERRRGREARGESE